LEGETRATIACLAADAAERSKGLSSKRPAPNARVPPCIPKVHSRTTPRAVLDTPVSAHRTRKSPTALLDQRLPAGRHGRALVRQSQRLPLFEQSIVFPTAR
jgi:hypothetical protein